MKSTANFYILDTVDSTNNYAMARVHAGLAKDGMAWFARDQHAGKGQRGSLWKSEPGQNIILSIVIAPNAAFGVHPFLFNALVAITVREFIADISSENVFIKWPNDLYIGDRKAGGILIENVYKGLKLTWSVVGIGININQQEFDDQLPNPVSLCMLSPRKYNAEQLSRTLHKTIYTVMEEYDPGKESLILETYNEFLYGKGRNVRLRRENMIFETTIEYVDENGQLHTRDVIERQFSFGEVQWLIGNR